MPIKSFNIPLNLPNIILCHATKGSIVVIVGDIFTIVIISDGGASVFFDIANELGVFFEKRGAARKESEREYNRRDFNSFHKVKY